MQAILHGYGSSRGKWDEQLGLYFGEGLAWEYPMYLGNMNFGEVEAVGDAVKRVGVGDTVAFSGPFQRYSIVSESECFLVPSDVSWKSAFLQDPGEFALGAIRDGNVRFGDHVAVFSLGAIGLTTVQMLKAAGAERVIGIDPLPKRRELALACGADAVLGDDPADIGWQIREISRREGIDVVIDFSGAVPAMQSAFRALAPLGTLVLGAYPDAKSALVDFGRESHANQLNIVFTRACSNPLRDHPRWDWHRIRRATWHAVCSGSLQGEPIVDDPVPFDELLDHYPRIANAPNETVKMSVVY
jgi:threonine dehydrogenase-like Zn-dependent dehydrogenase